MDWRKGAQQQEIERLQKLLAEKEIYSQSTGNRQDQAKTLQETTTQAACPDAQRLATRPGLCFSYRRG
jgi:hypothetical protein